MVSQCPNSDPHLYWETAGLASGTYTIKQGAFSANWSGIYAWEDNAAIVNLDVAQNSTTLQPSTILEASTVLQVAAALVNFATWQTTAQLQNPIVSAGVSNGFITTFTVAQDGTYILDLELFDSNGNKVKQWSVRQKVSAQSPQTLTWAFTPEAKTYQVKQGIFDSNWKTLYWNDNSLSFSAATIAQNPNPAINPILNPTANPNPIPNSIANPTATPNPIPNPIANPTATPNPLANPTATPNSTVTTILPPCSPTVTSNPTATPIANPNPTATVSPLLPLALLLPLILLLPLVLALLLPPILLLPLAPLPNPYSYSQSYCYCSASPTPAPTATPAPTPLPVTPPTVTTGFQRGVNLSGAEFAPTNLPGTLGKDYTYPTAGELDYYKSKGLTLIRLPFLWERLQPSLYGPLNQNELNNIADFISAARDRGMKVILEPHNYDRYRLNATNYLIGSPQVPVSAFDDFWNKFAGYFRNETAIYAYSLMNEPHDTNGTWKDTAQAGLNSLRQVDMNRPGAGSG